MKTLIMKEAKSKSIIKSNESKLVPVILEFRQMRQTNRQILSNILTAGRESD